MLLLSALQADDNGCTGSNRCIGKANSNEVCRDVPAPGTGYSCGCLSSSAWDAATNACAACVSIVAGTGSQGYTGDGGPAPLPRCLGRGVCQWIAQATYTLQVRLMLL
jgi:hypothetical protein